MVWQAVDRMAEADPFRELSTDEALVISEVLGHWSTMSAEHAVVCIRYLEHESYPWRSDAHFSALLQDPSPEEAHLSHLVEETAKIADCMMEFGCASKPPGFALDPVGRYMWNESFSLRIPYETKAGGIWPDVYPSGRVNLDEVECKRNGRILIAHAARHRCGRR